MPFAPEAHLSTSKRSLCLPTRDRTYRSSKLVAESIVTQCPLSAHFGDLFSASEPIIMNEKVLILVRYLI
jgi:hypothetical protein